jgi:iron complex transport system substrate-binding protein
MNSRFTHITLFASVAVLFFYACTNHVSLEQRSELPVFIRDTSVKHAKRFTVYKADSFTVIYLFANRDMADTTYRFVLYKNRKPGFYRSQEAIRIPCKRIVSLSSIYSNMLIVLGGLKNIVAVENIDYYGRKDLLDRFQNGYVEEVQRSNDLNREMTIQLRPDVIFSFGMGNSSREKEDKISNSGIPFVICLDHLEETPLARAEWIKFFACFLGKEAEAAAFFSKVERRYDSIKQLALMQMVKPTVFSELKFGDTWYVPAGRSYMAKLLEDAGADYLWKEDTLTGSLPLSFETVYRKAKAADYWLNVSMCTSLKAMLEQDSRYADFKAFKNKMVFNNTKRLNTKGYTSYWETGITEPDLILNDLFHVINSHDKTDSLESKLYYYTRLN